MTYKKKILLLFICSSIFPLIALTFYFMVPYTNEQRTRITYLMDSSIWQKKTNLVTELNDYQRILSSMMTNPEITSSIHDINKLGKRDAAVSLNVIKSFFSVSIYLKNEIEGFLYFNPSTNIFITYNKLNSTDEEVVEYVLHTAPGFTDRIEDSQGALTYIATDFMDNINKKQVPIVLFGGKFLDANRSEFSGYIFILLNEEKLHTILNSPNLHNSVQSTTFLLDSTNTIIASSNQEFTNVKYDIDMYGTSSSYLDVHLSLGKANLSLVTIFNEEDLYGNRLFFILIPLVITFITTLLSFLLVKNYILKITNYVVEINESLTISDDQVHFTLKTSKDLELIAQKFEQMKKQINSLLIDQKNKTQMLLTNEEKRRVAEIKAIEAQVNPHFIYNILNTLNWVALEQGNTLISNGISDLASILRYSISHIDTKATIREEVDWIEKYLSLQALRYEDTFTYTITWDETLAEEEIYKLLFQPFIENAIVHGFQGITYKGHLSISITQAGERIRITIRDNGIGFETLKRKKSTGIESATSRMQLYYGKEAVCTIRSLPEACTTIEILIPRGTNENTDC